ncbi:HpcH/HpaI aldolase/citrate lyase family protein [Microbacterium sp. NPDC057944]|uniref:HpcH/HpaI aldolase/citrate lyase family protein n=1 Tax=Microbacterium sp. NPDC057944 TaxID=3346286 RepID=UPI0036DC067E
MDLYRTGLYVPGDRPDRFGSAESSGADLVVFDLEDAVAPDRKALARDAVVEWLRGGRHAAGSAANRAADATSVAVQVRVNAGDEDDLRAVSALPEWIGIRLPKVESAADVDRVASVAPGRPLIALLESARGVVNATEIAQHPVVSALALGESDLRSDVGGGERMLEHARLTVLFAARAAGLPAPMASVFPAIRDLEGLDADTRRAADLGLFGRMAVHPSQLPVIAAVFSPTPAEVAWAEEVLAALAAGGVATLASGEMVDPAMRARAECIRSLVG